MVAWLIPVGEVEVGAELKFQLVLLPESVRLKPAVVILVALVFLESLTSRYDKLRVPCGLISHWVPVVDDRNDKRLAAAPCKVSVLETVCVLDASKNKVSATVITLRKALKIVEPSRR